MTTRVHPTVREIRILWPDEDGAPFVLVARVQKAGAPETWTEFRIWDECPFAFLAEQLAHGNVEHWPARETRIDGEGDLRPPSWETIGPPRNEARWGLIQLSLDAALSALEGDDPNALRMVIANILEVLVRVKVILREVEAR